MWPDENFHRAVEATATVIGVFDLDLALGLQALEMLAAHEAAVGRAWCADRGIGLQSRENPLARTLLGCVSHEITGACAAS